MTEASKRELWRVFVALPTSEDARARITEIQSRLKQVHVPARWERTDKLHMTLRFLGDTSPQALPDLASALRSSLSGRKELTLRYTALGAFPSLTHPRVIWIGAEEEPELKEIQEIVDRECRRLGLAQADDRRFHPHITLARMKEGRGADILTATVKTLTFEPISDRCAGVQILRSELHPTGSRYTVLEHIPFQPSELEISHG